MFRFPVPVHRSVHPNVIGNFLDGKRFRVPVKENCVAAPSLVPHPDAIVISRQSDAGIRIADIGTG